MAGNTEPVLHRMVAKPGVECTEKTIILHRYFIREPGTCVWHIACIPFLQREPRDHLSERKRKPQLGLFGWYGIDIAVRNIANVAAIKTKICRLRVCERERWDGLNTPNP